MSAPTAWGKTGRVVLGGEYVRIDLTRDVVVDDASMGRILAPRGGKPFTGWGAITYAPYAYADDHPSLDAAVMWVLRRAAPKVWREERGPVWLVASGCIRFGHCQCRYHWHIYRPDGSEYTDNGSTEGASGWHWAMREVATERARFEAAS